jgi:hypothetical protein
MCLMSNNRAFFQQKTAPDGLAQRARRMMVSDCAVVSDRMLNRVA